MFTGLNEAICQQAWDVIQPSIREAAESGFINGFRGALAVVSLDKPDGKPMFVATLGEEPANYPEWAVAKARLAYRTRTDTTSLRNDVAHLYRPGDIKWPGGIWRDGLAVGFSGVEGEYDVMIAEWFVSAVKAICRIAFYGPEGEGAQPTPYLGREQ